MKLNINWKLFLILFVASIIASLLVIPYALALSPALASVFTPVVLIAQLIQSTILFAIAILVGLTLYKHVGFKIPILEGLLEGKEVINYLKSILGISVGLGVLAGVLIILSSFLFTSASTILQGAELTVPLWKSFLASFYGGIGEEILFRLFVMTVIVWVFYKIKKTPEGKPTTIGIWLAIIITAILFGVGHLPITSSIITITPMVIARAIVLNGIGAIIFGWLYWKKGLESAMISHFSADIVLHVMFPLILSSLI